MNINFENDIENEIMRLTVSIDTRARMSQERKKVKWGDVEASILKDYTCPNGFTLGECVNKLQVVDNDSAKTSSRTWIFPLVKKQTTQIKKTSPRSTTSKKKTPRRASTRRMKSEE